MNSKYRYVPYSISKSFAYVRETPTTNAYSTKYSFEILHPLESSAGQRIGWLTFLFAGGPQSVDFYQPVGRFGGCNAAPSAGCFIRYICGTSQCNGCGVMRYKWYTRYALCCSLVGPCLHGTSQALSGIYMLSVWQYGSRGRLLLAG